MSGKDDSSASDKALRVAGMFAGIGGLELGLKRAGHEAAILCEIDEGAKAVLSHHFPHVPLFPDVRELAELPEDVDFLVAGFPCQDLSQAGGTAGIQGSQSGLVDHVFRLLAQNPVEWVLLENVPFMLQLNRGSAMDYIVTRLESFGYSWAYRVIDSRSFGLPQRRERVFLLASLKSNPIDLLLQHDQGAPPEHSSEGRACGFYWTEGTRGLGWAIDAVPTLKGGSTVGIPSPPAIWLPDGTIVTPDIRDAERLQGFDADWTLPAAQAVRASYRWKLVGNSVTVEVAHWIGKLLLSRRSQKISVPGFPLNVGGTWPRAAFGSKGKRFTAYCSSWPIRRTVPPLTQFLQFPVKLLSEKATAGFAKRLKASRLTYPPEFMLALDRHLLHMTAEKKSSTPTDEIAELQVVEAIS